MTLQNPSSGCFTFLRYPGRHNMMRNGRRYATMLRGTLRRWLTEAFTG
jgi:hypothetical protein